MIGITNNSHQFMKTHLSSTTNKQYFISFNLLLEFKNNRKKTLLNVLLKDYNLNSSFIDAGLLPS